jgi:hypothetical protein
VDSESLNTQAAARQGPLRRDLVALPLAPGFSGSLIASRGDLTRLCQETGLKAIYGSRSHAPEKGAAGHSVYAWLPSLRV